MEYEAQKVGEVKGLGIIYRVDAPLDNQIEAFKKVGITAPFLATPEEMAEIRLAGVPDNWSRTSVAPIATKGGKTILFKYSPLMNPLMAVSAVTAHRNGVCPTMGREVYEAAEAIAKSQEGIEPEDRTAVFVSQDGDFSLTPKMEQTRFLLGRQTTPYFAKFVNGGKDGKIPFYNLSGEAKDKSTVNYLWFYDPHCESNFLAGDLSLNNDVRAFGVLRNAEGSAKNSGYSLTEIAKANSEVIPVVFQEVGMSGLTNLIARPLNKGLTEELRRRNG